MSTTTILQEMEGLAQSISASIRGCRVDFKTFPSGAGWIDVFLDDHLYQMVYMPTEKVYGVDELLDEDPPFSMYFRFFSPDFEPAAQRLWGLIKGEVKVSANGAA